MRKFLARVLREQADRLDPPVKPLPVKDLVALINSSTSTTGLSAKVFYPKRYTP